MRHAEALPSSSRWVLPARRCKFGVPEINRSRIVGYNRHTAPAGQGRAAWMKRTDLPAEGGPRQPCATGISASQRERPAPVWAYCLPSAVRPKLLYANDRIADDRLEAPSDYPGCSLHCLAGLGVMQFVQRRRVLGAVAAWCRRVAARGDHHLRGRLCTALPLTFQLPALARHCADAIRAVRDITWSENTTPSPEMPRPAACSMSAAQVLQVCVRL